MNARLLCFVMLVLLSFSAHAEEQDPMLHQGYPVVEDNYQMNRAWSVTLPGKFNRRYEGEGLVIWRPGFTMWFSVHDRDHGETQEDLLNEILADVSSEAFDKATERAEGLIRYSYRLMEEPGVNREATFYGFTIGSNGHIQMRVYLDNPEDISLAKDVWLSLAGPTEQNR